MNDLKKLLRVMFLKGFTLIELLVVIAIIAILAAILFPVFAQAREKARQSTCLSNLKNLGTAIMMYTDDYDEMYPFGYLDTTYLTSGGTWNYWLLTLNPYVKNYKVFTCPSGPVKYKSDEIPSMGNYSANRGLMPYHHSGSQVPAISRTSVNTPADIYAVFDASYYSLDAGSLALCGLFSAYLPGSGDVTGLSYSASGPSWGSADFKSGRHNGGINMAYADGHAKYLKSSDVWNAIFLTTKSPFLPDTWN